MVYFPPHFPQRKKSGSDFSPHSDSSEDEQSMSSASDNDQIAPPTNTYAPPPTFQLDNSDRESGSSMEPRLTASPRHGVAPCQPVPVRNRPVNYRQFYSASGSSGSGSSSGSEVGWRRKRREVGPTHSNTCTLIPQALVLQTLTPFFNWSSILNTHASEIRS